MPFMVGKSPIRRTMKYLQSGQINFRENVKVFSINYNISGEHHKGAKEFIFWYMPQVQFKNPDVQCITFKHLTPSPFIKLFLNDGKTVLIDIDSRNKDDIHDHLKNFVAVCKTKVELEYEAKAQEKKDNPANFGHYCEKHCMCEVPGQLPCPNVVPLPFHMRGKYKYQNN